MTTVTNRPISIKYKRLVTLLSHRGLEKVEIQYTKTKMQPKQF